MTAADIATNYLHRGWAVIPVPFQTKKPVLAAWEKLRITEADIGRYFRGQSNVGVQLGEPSNWLVDVDLDCPEAVELAPQFLPMTPAVFGRAGKPRSHYLYRSTGSISTQQNRAPDKSMLVELRSTGGQTVFPGSVHPSGEPITWHSEGDPATVQPEQIQQCVAKLVAAVKQKRGIVDEPSQPRKPTAPDRIKLVERASKYLATIPGAIEGQGGDPTTFHALCELFKFALTDDEAWSLISEWNKSCVPPWTEKDLRRNLQGARERVVKDGEFGFHLQDDHKSNGHSKGQRPKRPRPTVEKATSKPAESPSPDEPVSIMHFAARTEMATARRFVSMFGDRVRWCDPWDKWLVWDAARWKIDDTCSVEALAKKTADAIWEEVKDELPQLDKSEMNPLLMFAKGTSSANGIAHMLTLARSETGIPILHTAFDAHPWLLNVQNGTLDLRSGKIRPHDRADLLTKVSPVTFDPDADCPRWCWFVAEIMDANRELIDFLRRLAGYWLTGSVQDHVLPILYGVGANGKSVFLNTLMALLGPDYAMKASSDFLLAKRNDSHPTERADLFGKRLVCCIETESGRRLAESLVKELTGGDPVRARRMKEDFWEFFPTHKLTIACNHRPPVRGTDFGICRRLRLVQFDVVFPAERQDKRLAEVLLSELPGILNWCLAGCIEWQAEGLKDPEIVTQATAGYRAENDTVAKFIADQCIVGNCEKVLATALYAAFVEWCGPPRESVMKRDDFTSRLDEMGFQRDRVTSGPGKGRIIRLGLGLTTNVSERSEVSEAQKR